MPNHVKNVITIWGDKKRVKEILDEIKVKGNLEDEESWDKIMEVNTIDFNNIIPMPAHIYRGDLGSEEREKYGSMNWYDWSIENWDTKWNAYDFEEGDDNQIVFSTAWSYPKKVYDELATMFNDVDFCIKYADEDFGYNCGEVIYRKGKLSSFTDRGLGGTESQKWAMELWGYDSDSIDEYLDY